ncbi:MULTISPECIES: LysR substrate-binding domain-containing protein [Paraburkholderia]|uniref:Transcriptional regulator, LysR family n=1 Tax=Paraburkholderia megapolitana TaxID=420953 RepID=A0A1I3ERJ3_9BURK|nr:MULTISPECIES: LysR substrate-binding domain-containing protein [Paraburkholderia]MCX4162672.1 LysR substrate-binding domain-containing protein [Paraburkholderia megapolitana]MDN7158167.1 LysR substrate-binding domain-containing protein [Paraburkholderia sp. CHISQ3]MDQ6495214.1 LysR substrate-binding domain-containing protein [Paraburkholderia megapolitana]QDQ80240.1 LysR family transcriptional regulator [Paraburkholderia megapolitana]SFI01596.1 transcriptional regulator, LysR family [Parabu
MTLSQLRAFCSVVEQGSFRAAARSLDIAQSALTHAIQSLEAELAVTLLTRSHLGISLTPFGEKLLVRASAILKDCERIDLDMRELEGEPVGRISLGVTSEPLAELLVPVLKNFMAAFPRVLVHVSSGSAQMLMERIRNGRLDFALCPLSPQVVDADLHIDRLYPSAPAVLARAGHPKAHATSIAELADCEWVGFRREGIVGIAANRLVGMFAAHGIEGPKIVITAETLLESLFLVCETDYLTMDPGVLASYKLFSGSLIRIPIRETFSRRDVSLIRRSTSPLTLVAHELSSMLISYARLQHGVARSSDA